MSDASSIPAAFEPPIIPVADGVDHPLDPRYITLQRRVGWIVAGIRSILLLAAMMPLLAWFSFYPLMALWILATIGLAFLSQWWPAIDYRYASYRVDSDGIEIRTGVIWKRVSNVPRSRVQHIDVSQGPFERQFGLGTLSIFTAGSAHAMVPLSGLDHAIAMRIRDHLLPRSEHDVV
jgi:membrane protein YdbS with pleckstrin-like domain